ncbi:unnamed protein product [Rotaria socialis]|uniref:MYND-type domain-containing protein n=1 Tax=Rotaria socialis TaxID=392032 RepID=A0A820MN86_9BILA|nr:unnamed protein product [Rotaria socialis]CAF3315997.1 unnamed protein product [Rotaria socialis]CAF3344304.1 unnamed protein product [Rotaria socialis]CAF3692875.1 unnamed protein product [Rotaria socialis]CAF3727930.1 unnamed protein product [Rotaria socialis]
MATTELVYPLAFPKSVVHKCEICGKAASRMCSKCRVTYYCSEEHQAADNIGIHDKICSTLASLRLKQPFLPSEEERRERDREIRDRKIHLVGVTRMIGERHVFQDRFEAAVPAALASLKLAIEVHGPRSVELIPSYLILAEASLGLKQLNQCWEYLSQAQYTVLQQHEQAPLAITSQLARNMAQLSIARKEYDDAARHLANDIYDASLCYGTEHHKVAGGYFLLGKVFKLMNRNEVTESLYTQVTQMWYNFLRRLLQSRVVFSDMDAILGKKDEDDEDELTSSSKLDLSTEAEAFNTLQTLLNYRLETQQTNPMTQELNKIHHCLTILYFLARDYIQVHDSMNKIKDCTIQDIEDDQQRILKFLEQLGQMKALMKRQQQQN